MILQSITRFIFPMDDFSQTTHLSAGRILAPNVTYFLKNSRKTTIIYLFIYSQLFWVYGFRLSFCQLNFLFFETANFFWNGLLFKTWVLFQFK